MKQPIDKPANFGRVIRQAYEGDRIWLIAENGEDLGFLEMKRVPKDLKITVALCFDRSIRIERREEER
jgi:hypothetical protein